MALWLPESPIYINIPMNLAILPELLGQFSLKWLGLAKNRLHQENSIIAWSSLEWLDCENIKIDLELAWNGA